MLNLWLAKRGKKKVKLEENEVKLGAHGNSPVVGTSAEWDCRQKAERAQTIADNWLEDSYDSDSITVGCYRFAKRHKAAVMEAG